LEYLDEDLSEREVAIESMTKSELVQFDAKSPEVTKVIRWPSFEFFKSASMPELRKLRIAKVEWHCSGILKSLRLTLNDGTISPIFGPRPPSCSQVFS
jgi:hypothetical protein